MSYNEINEVLCLLVFLFVVVMATRSFQFIKDSIEIYIFFFYRTEGLKFK